MDASHFPSTTASLRFFFTAISKSCFRLEASADSNLRPLQRKKI